MWVWVRVCWCDSGCEWWEGAVCEGKGVWVVSSEVG